MRRSFTWLIGCLLALAALAGCSAPKETVTVTERPEPIPSTERPAVSRSTLPEFPAGFDTVRAQRFDYGRMWTFDEPPTSYFQEQYGFAPDSSWFRRVRLGALRFGSGCSSSFVSPNGLIMTNHHCARESITEVDGPDEDLLEEGFYAETTEEERTVKDLHVDQLVETRDVTKQILAAGRNERSPAARVQAQQQRAQQLQEKLTDEAKGRNENLRVEVVGLYDGARYKAYTYRRYDDVRLVMVPELQVAYFGGTPDNFTYPRYSLDVAFFRAYDDEGNPVNSPNHFTWSTSGAEEGSAVFVAGFPGSTSRTKTVSQLKYDRTFDIPYRLDVLRARSSILDEYIQANPDSAAQYDLRNFYFTIENTVKSLEGQLQGLNDPYLIARRTAAERALQKTITETDSLKKKYGNTLEEIEQLQNTKRSIARKAGAFSAFSSTALGSRILTRAIYGYYHDLLRRRGAPPDRLQEIREDAYAVENWPAAVEQTFIAARLREIRDGFGESDPTVQRLLRNTTPEQLAENLVQNSALMDSTSYAQLLEEGYLNSDDPSVPVIEAIGPLYFNITQQRQDFEAAEQTLNAELTRVRLTTTDAPIPPDANFTLRLSDGVVKPYEYNGTRAPAFTNFYGLLDHYYSYNMDAWALPEPWINLPDDFNRSTALNLVSTNDITGGNSGSPLLNKDLEVVGLIFDSNIQALPNEYLYTNQNARAVSVDARGIMESLRNFYGADRLVSELTSGSMTQTDARPAGGSSE